MRRGAELTTRSGRISLYLYTHGIQQLSNAAWMLSADGHSPGELDFLQFLNVRERGG